MNRLCAALAGFAFAVLTLPIVLLAWPFAFALFCWIEIEDDSLE